MDYAAHAAATAPTPAADPHPTYAHPYGYPYTYPAYHQPDPAAAADPSAASSSSSYYYSNPTGAPADAQAQYNPYATYHQYYAPSAAVPYGGGGPGEYYFTAGEASQAPAVSAAQAAPAATTRDKVKHFGFDPQRYAQRLRALNGLVDAIRTPLVDELHGRGELPRLVALLCAADPRVRALALRVAYYGRGEVLDALLAEGLVKRLLCLQRSDLGGSATDKDAEGGDTAALSASRRPFVSAMARFTVQVEVGQGLGPRERRAAKLDILRRVRKAAVSPAKEATVLTEVL